MVVLQRDMAEFFLRILENVSHHLSATCYDFMTVDVPFHYHSAYFTALNGKSSGCLYLQRLCFYDYCPLNEVVSTVVVLALPGS